MSIKQILEESIKKANERSRATELPICEDVAIAMASAECYEPIRQSIWRETHAPNKFLICLRSSDYQDSSSDTVRDWGWKVPAILKGKLDFCGIKLGEHVKLTFVPVNNTDFNLFFVIF